MLAMPDPANDAARSDEMLAEAFTRLRSPLTMRARAIVGNRQDAEDAVQEAVARAWRARRRLRHGSDPTPWLRTIVTRVAIDLARWRHRHVLVPIDELDASTVSTEQQVILAETLAEVSGAAARLTAGPRRTLFLHDVAGLTSHEIARLDDVPYHTVRTRLRRARLLLRDELREAI